VPLQTALLSYGYESMTQNNAAFCFRKAKLNKKTSSPGENVEGLVPPGKSRLLSILSDEFKNLSKKSDWLK